ncbi:MAG: hypothetical protein HY809_10270 [Nitrospirae bacterium]|nr:hypothetical protein [Nitrospirota bacterium]
MRPFDVPIAIKTITTAHPTANVIIQAASKGGTLELEAISRLWLSEGIPFAFREMPALYEVLRDWISKRLSIHAKEITLIGSGRQGSSISPPPKTGKPFDMESDLDWTIVSESLFYNCEKEFNTWADDYKNDTIHPRHPSEKGFWDENLISCTNTIQRGFIDPHKIPTWDRYPLSQLIAQTMWMIKGKCEVTEGSPKFRKSTVRVYRDWHGFIGQLSINLRHVARACHQ